MLRALVDANVLISAAIRPSGPPGLILAALLSRQAFELVLSAEIIAEAASGLSEPRIRKYVRDPNAAQRWLSDIVAVADLVEDTGRVVGICRDAADDRVLAAASEGVAQYIVTGDRDLLVLREYAGIAIVAPRVFIDLLG